MLVVATRNPGKVREFGRLLAAYPWDVRGLDDIDYHAEIPEPFDTYADNARAKAEQVSSATGLVVLADDSGIEVPALKGWPGPLSARWMGPDATDADRLRGLIDEIERRTPDDRRLRYVAALALARPGADTVVAHGSCDGVLVHPSGSGGFGYDPGFFSDELGMTFGDAPQARKDTVSHRARALQRLAQSGVLAAHVGQA